MDKVAFFGQSCARPNAPKNKNIPRNHQFKMFKFFKQEKLSEDEIRDRSIQTMGKKLEFLFDTLVENKFLFNFFSNRC